MTSPPIVLGPMEWGLVVLSCAVVFFFLGGKLMVDVR
ncbi:MAG: hypothetical protein ACI8RZ_002654, partial [Myxococcota bacterium]